MTALLTLALLAGSPCTRVAVTPFEPLATTPAVAREVEAQVRAALAARPGLCVEPRGTTVERLAQFPRHRLPPCADNACLAAQLTTLESDELVSGVVVGVGAHRSVELVRSTATRTSRSTSAADTAAQLTAVVGVLYQWDAQQPTSARRLWPTILLASASLASAGAGVALGLESRRTEQVLSSGVTGCPGGGTAYRDCLDGQVRAGRTEATAANVLFGLAGALAVGAVVHFVVDLP